MGITFEYFNFPIAVVLDSLKENRRSVVGVLECWERRMRNTSCPLRLMSHKSRIILKSNLNVSQVN